MARSEREFLDGGGFDGGSLSFTARPNGFGGDLANANARVPGGISPSSPKANALQDNPVVYKPPAAGATGEEPAAGGGLSNKVLLLLAVVAVAVVVFGGK